MLARILNTTWKRIAAGVAAVAVVGGNVVVVVVVGAASSSSPPSANAATAPTRRTKPTMATAIRLRGVSRMRASTGTVGLLDQSSRSSAMRSSSGGWVSNMRLIRLIRPSCSSTACGCSIQR